MSIKTVRSWTCLSVLLLNLGLASSAVWGATYTVTNTDDSGAGSLRQGIAWANANPGTTITFSLNGATSNGVYFIRPTSALPSITGNGTVVDGTTQTSRSDSNPYGPEIQLDLSMDNSSAYLYHDHGAITIQASNCLIKGLVINRYIGAGFTFAALESAALMSASAITRLRLATSVRMQRDRKPVLSSTPTPAK
jgi:hypothetical protein